MSWIKYEDVSINLNLVQRVYLMGDKIRFFFNKNDFDDIEYENKEDAKFFFLDLQRKLWATTDD